MTIYLYTALLTILYFVISITVIKGRWKHKVSLGSGESNEIIHLVSAHSNFSSYVPFFLICFYLLETSDLNKYILHLLGSAFLLGRILHFASMKNQEQKFKFRKAGMILTLWPMLISSVFLLYFYFFEPLSLTSVHK